MEVKSYSLDTLFNKWNKGLLIIPFYQRPYTWNNTDKMKLFDTILNYKASIGGIVLREFKNGTFNIIDGQQRLNTIFKYMNNEYSLSKNFKSKNNIDYKNKKYKELSLEDRTYLDNMDVSVTIYKDIELIDEIRIFENIQRGRKLSKDDLLKNMTDFKIIELSHTLYEIYKETLKEYSQAHNEQPYFISMLSRSLYLLYLYKKNNKIIFSNLKTNELIDKFSRMNEQDNEILNIASTFCENKILKPLTKEKDKTFFIDKIRFILLTLSIIQNDIFGLKVSFTRTKDILSMAIYTKKLENKEILRAIDVSSKLESVFSTIYSEFFKNLSEDEQVKIIKDEKRVFTNEEREYIYIKDSKKCRICGKEILLSESEIDHIIPHSKGGKTDLSNAQLLCINCNRKKYNLF